MGMTDGRLRPTVVAAIAATLSLFIVASISSPASATAPRHHHHSPKYLACKKQATAQNLHFHARHSFMHDCLRS
jgi:hypothetical protein